MFVKRFQVVTSRPLLVICSVHRTRPVQPFTMFLMVNMDPPAHGIVRVASTVEGSGSSSGYMGPTTRRLVLRRKGRR